jgi:hypothetical protein
MTSDCEQPWRSAGRQLYIYILFFEDRILLSNIYYIYIYMYIYMSNTHTSYLYTHSGKDIESAKIAVVPTNTLELVVASRLCKRKILLTN